MTVVPVNVAGYAGMSSSGIEAVEAALSVDLICHGQADISSDALIASAQRSMGRLISDAAAGRDATRRLSPDDREGAAWLVRRGVWLAGLR